MIKYADNSGCQKMVNYEYYHSHKIVSTSKLFIGHFPRIFAICLYITELDLYVASKVTLYVDFLSDDYDER